MADSVSQNPDPAEMAYAAWDKWWPTQLLDEAYTGQYTDEGSFIAGWHSRDDEVASLRAALAAREEAISTAAAKIKQVLDDEESQHPHKDGGRGWGPDVTMVGVLREAYDLLAALPSEEPGNG